MIKTIKLLKGSWFGRLLVSVLCISLLMLAMPAKAPAPTAVEYAVMLALIIVVCITAIQEPGSPIPNEPWHMAYGVVANQLQTAYEGAQDANSMGDTILEISRLSNGIGAAKALLGITSSCDACDEIRTALQGIIGGFTVLRSEALGAVVSGCHPNGKIQKSEECDPLANITGCGEGFFCNDECLCEPTIIP